MSAWIGVEDRLPEHNSSVLVWCPERRNKYTAIWEGSYWVHFGGGFYEVNEKVTHWMPTPEPPSEEK